MEELNYMKDKIFDFLNESREFGIADIDTNDRENLFTVSLYNGTVIEIQFRQTHSAASL